MNVGRTDKLQFTKIQLTVIQPLNRCFQIQKLIKFKLGETNMKIVRICVWDLVLQFSEKMINNFGIKTFCDIK